ncbi:protein YgfX [Thiobacillus sp. 65-1402]|uniref:protein YgfX n=1 Tax=Thiobacillus sp. 65-1402 TaxID=1895861 RepID=UPI0025EC1D15|nr:protein YgfX [Thiobacillus sp. 65-1402]
MYTLMREIELKPSRRLGLLLLGMTMLALAAIHLAAVPAAVQLALGMAVIGLGVRGWRQARRTDALRVAADGGLQCLDDAGEWRDVEVLGDSLVSPALIVLRYRVADKRVRSLALLSDSADADDLRRLRVALRWTRRIRSGTSSPDAG